MDKDKLALILAGASVGAAGLTAGIASTMLINRTLMRPKETSQDIIKEFADPEKMAGYALKMAPVGEWLQAQHMEDLWLESFDGLRLHAFYLPAPAPSRKLVIIHHGFTSKAMDNATHAKFFHEMGYEVLLLDLRAHGGSDGEYVGFGILDRFDTLEWVKYVRKRFGTDIRIVLHGTSMGGATVLMALGLPEIQETVSAVIADCGYTSPSDIFSYVIQKNYHLPPAPILKATNLRVQSMAGYRYDDYSTVDALKNNRVPVLFIHGKEDKFVPTWMSQMNYDVCTGKKQLLFMENAGHGSSLFENPSLYEKTEKDFLAEVMGEDVKNP